MKSIPRTTITSCCSDRSPQDRLRLSDRDSLSGNLYAAGARSFSIRRADGELVYDSGSILDREAHARLIYDDGRSRDKGVEPEGVAILQMVDRTYAFVGLERTIKSAVAIFDITDLDAVRFIDIIVTSGNLSPEGLANEVAAPGSTTSNTSLLHARTIASRCASADSP